MNHREQFEALTKISGPYLFCKYGSRVYGTAGENSDYDFHAIIPRKFGDYGTGVEIRNGDLNVTIYEQTDFLSHLKEHKIHALETYFSDDECRKLFGSIKIDKQILRRVLAAKSSHSYVKAKKKIEVEKDYYLGWKSLFHSLRILEFGFQLAVEGKISDFSVSNHYWTTIRDAQIYQWSDLEKIYKPIHNELSSKFRLLAPKE